MSIIEALKRVIEAQAEHDKAIEEHDGYGWGDTSYSFRLIKAIDNASAEFEEALEEHIIKVIEKRELEHTS